MAAAVAHSQTKVAILGAGLTGMSAAYHLRQTGLAARVFERASRVGGLVVTDEERGYRFDRTGHLLHVQDDAVAPLALEWIGSARNELVRRSAVWSHEVYTRYPYQANAFGLPPKVAFDCVMGFIEAQRLRDERAADEPLHDFEQYCVAHFGKPISDHFMIPYNTRLWGVAPSEITAEWCDRFVPRPSLEDVVAGAVGLADRELGYNKSFAYPRRGIAQLSEGLAADVEGIELQRSPRRIDLVGRRLCFDDEQVQFDTLISTIPLPALVALCDPVPEHVNSAAALLRCTSLSYVDIALRSPCRKPYHWVYVPEAKYPFYRVGCYSNFSAAMAPVGCASLYVELVDRDPPELSKLLPDLAAALMKMGFFDHPEAILFARMRRIEHAYVIFDHNYFQALQTVQDFLRAKRILSTGRYGGWNYSSMADALGFGRDAAAQAATWAEQEAT